MALTKVSTDGVKDDAITSGKIPANAVGASELADNAVDTNAIASNAVTAGKTSGVQTTINNNADNRVITGSGTANTLNGQSGFTVNTSNNVLLAGGGFGIQNVGGVISGSGGGQDHISIKDSGSTERVVVKTHGTYIGNVGIGEASPARKLSVTDATFPAIRIKNSNTSIANDTNIAGLEFEHADSSAAGVCAGINARMADTSTGALHMTFSTGTNVNLYKENMRLDMSGHLGIGKTSPNIGSHTKTLTVSDTGTGARAAVEIEGNTANAHAVLEFYNNGTLVSGLNSRGSDRLQFVTGSSGTVRGQFTSNGLNFGSDTAAANALNDYEEGSWTPTTPNTGGNGFSSIISATYTKIGNVVHIQFYANFDSQSSGSQCHIGGLPFQSRGNSIYTYLSGRLQGHASAELVMQMGGSVSYGVLYYDNANLSYSNVSSYYCLLSGFYYTDS